MNTQQPKRIGLLLTLMLVLALSAGPVMIAADEPAPERLGTLGPFPSELKISEALGAPSHINNIGIMGLGSTGSGIAAAADWLLGEQDSAGWFPWTPGGGVTTNTQGPSARGLLRAYVQTGDNTHLVGAEDTGDYLVPNYPRVYTDGDPRIATHDPLFLEQLSQVNGDAKYANFVQTYFWDKLTAGAYGEANDMDAADFGDAVVDSRTTAGQVALSPWDLSATAIAAHVAGETAIRDALMSKVLRGLDETITAGGFDVAGLAGAVWASAVTGVDLDPTAGVYASDASTADLVVRLRALQLTASGANRGGWPYSTRGPVPEFTNAAGVWQVAFGDSFETTLTKQFTNVTVGTLGFDMRINIEDGWDYGQVLISTDGASFTALVGSYTTTSDPYGQNPGNGITGFVAGDGQIAESMTIPGFVSGSDYWVRFRFVGDAGASGNGGSALTFNWEIDNITVNGATDAASSVNGWVADSVATDKGSTQNTAFAIMALNAYNRAANLTEIARGAAFIRGIQETSGELLKNPVATPSGSGSVEVHSEALAALVDVAPADAYVDASWTSGVDPGDDPDGAGPAVAYGFDAFATIWEGIDAVQGSTVNVADGTYTEQIEITDKAVTITGESEGGVIVQANSGGPVDGQNTFTIDAAGKDVTIQNMTIRHGDYGIRSSAGNVNVLQSTFYHNGWDDGTGVPGTPTQAGMLAFWNAHSTNGGAMRIQNSAGSEIANCTVYENDRGIRYEDGANGDIHDNTSYNNIQSGIYLAASTYTGASGSTDTEVYDNEVYGNMNNGLLSIGGKGNTFENNNVHDNWNSGVMLWHVGDNTIRDNIIDHNNLYAFNGQGVPGDAYGGVYAEGDTIAAGAAFVFKLLGNIITDNMDGAAGQAIGVRLDESLLSAGIEIKQNTFKNHDVDIHVRSQAATTVVNDNSFDGLDAGIQNDDAATLDAEDNWWGAADGPGTVGPGSGDTVSINVDYDPWLSGVAVGTLQDAIDAASPGDVILLGPYTYEGGLTIGSGITLQGQPGTVIGPGSPGTIVAGDDVTIDGLTYDGTGGDPGDSGIVVNDGVQRLWIRNCEIRNWPEDGVHFNGATTDLKVVDNYVHDNGGDGMEFNATPGGTVQVYGNAFRSNTGSGINAMSPSSVSATYNEWGDVAGPTGGSGDGVTGSVTYDPWVFGKLWADAPTTAREEENFTVQIKTEAHHLYGVEFDLTFDASKLQVVSTADGDFLGSASSAVSYDNSAGTLSYHYSRQDPDAEYDAPPEGYGVLEITFEAQDISGVSSSTTIDLDTDSVKLGAKGGVNIFVDSVTDDDVLILGTTTVSGVVDLQGRDDDSGAEVDPQAGSVYGYDPTASTTGAWGTYSFAHMTDDTYIFTAEMPRYLDAQKTAVAVAGETLDLGTVVLLGGDTNDDDYIDISDLSTIGGAFGTIPGDTYWNSNADINADDVVNILDLVLAGGNWHKADSPWS